MAPRDPPGCTFFVVLNNSPSRDKMGQNGIFGFSGQNGGPAKMGPPGPLPDPPVGGIPPDTPQCQLTHSTLASLPFRSLGIATFGRSHLMAQMAERRSSRVAFLASLPASSGHHTVQMSRSDMSDRGMAAYGSPRKGESCRYHADERLGCRSRGSTWESRWRGGRDGRSVRGVEGGAVPP